MAEFEYRVIPAPKRGQKEKGVKTAEARFALGLEQELNRLAAEGWEFLRAETLPSEERSGLTSTTTVFRSVLVLRRALAPVAPMAMIADQSAAPLAAAHPAPLAEPQPEPLSENALLPEEIPEKDWAETPHRG